MLSAYNPVPTLAVKDLDAARTFYEDTLGLTPSDESMPDGVMYTVGSGRVFVYPSAYAGTNKATAVSFDVPTEKFDEEVAALRDKGLEFQTFDLPGATWEDGVAGNDEYQVRVVRRPGRQHPQHHRPAVARGARPPARRSAPSRRASRAEPSRLHGAERRAPHAPAPQPAGASGGGWRGWTSSSSPRPAGAPAGRTPCCSPPRCGWTGGPCSSPPAAGTTGRRTGCSTSRRTPWCACVRAPGTTTTTRRATSDAGPGGDAG